MRRRRQKNILQGVCILALAVAFMMAGPLNLAQAKTLIRLGGINPPKNPITLGHVKFAELVKQKTGGKVEVKSYPASQLGNALTQIDR